MDTQFGETATLISCQKWNGLIHARKVQSSSPLTSVEAIFLA